MKLYIVKAYADEHKMNNSVDICGYYTNKTSLITAVKRHREELGIDPKVDITALIRNDDWRTFNMVAETSLVEITDTNHWLF